MTFGILNTGHFGWIYESFSKQLSSALDAITKKSKLYKTMGFFAGSAIALMMI